MRRLSWLCRATVACTFCRRRVFLSRPDRLIPLNWRQSEFTGSVACESEACRQHQSEQEQRAARTAALNPEDQ